MKPRWNAVPHSARPSCNRMSKTKSYGRKSADFSRNNDSLGSFLSDTPFIDHAATCQHSPERFAPGEVLAGRFRIVSFIAAGGMGEVYKAEDPRLDRIVVLKFLAQRTS